MAYPLGASWDEWPSVIKHMRDSLDAELLNVESKANIFAEKRKVLEDERQSLTIAFTSSHWPGQTNRVADLSNQMKDWALRYDKVTEQQSKVLQASVKRVQHQLFAEELEKLPNTVRTELFKGLPDGNARQPVSRAPSIGLPDDIFQTKGPSEDFRGPQDPEAQIFNHIASDDELTGMYLPHNDPFSLHDPNKRDSANEVPVDHPYNDLADDGFENMAPQETDVASHPETHATDDDPLLHETEDEDPPGR